MSKYDEHVESRLSPSGSHLLQKSLFFNIMLTTTGLSALQMSHTPATSTYTQRCADGP